MEKKKIFTDVVMTANKPNANGHIYPRNVLEKAVTRLQERLKNKPMLGEMNSTGYKIKLSSVSHQTVDVEMIGNEVQARVEVLDTPQGKVLRELLKSGSYKLSPVGYGDVGEDMVVSGYSITGIHVDTSNDQTK